MTSSSPVPDILLSLEKTNRYILHLLKLLTETAAPYLSFPIPSPNHITTESRSHDAIHAAIPELTFLARLFHVLVVWQTGKTLGMERLGMIFRSSSKTETNSPFTSQHLRAWSFVLLYTFSPYLVHRAGRGGWQDFNLVYQELKRRISSGKLFERYNHEDLRGERRRRVFEEMRSRMLERSVERDDDESRIQREELGQVEEVTGRTESTHPSFITSTRRSIWYILSCISKLSEDIGLIPNELPSRTDTTNFDGTQQVQLQDQSIREDTEIDHHSALIKWIIRFNLALFYLNGRYPTILYRLTGIQMKGSIEDNVANGASMHWSRPCYKFVGRVMIIHAIAKAVQASSLLSLNTWYSRRLIEQREERRRERHPNNTIEDSSRIRAETLSSSMEARVPSLKKTSIMESGGYIAETVCAGNQTSPIQCSICMNNRKNPSALSGCGHVFCWSCVQHWISTVRSECPICRTTARVQDVIPLYNYVP